VRNQFVEPPPASFAQVHWAKFRKSIVFGCEQNLGIRLNNLQSAWHAEAWQRLVTLRRECTVAPVIQLVYLERLVGSVANTATHFEHRPLATPSWRSGGSGSWHSIQSRPSLSKPFCLTALE